MVTTNSRAKRYFKAIQYKHLSKATYEIVMVYFLQQCHDDCILINVAQLPYRAHPTELSMTNSCTR